jgi:uncharacterized RDD family membrane protein YckC
MSALPVEVRAAQGTTAGLVSRLVAALVDMVFIAVMVLVGYLAVVTLSFVLRPRLFRWPEPSTTALVGVVVVVSLVYLAMTWATTGRSFGKHVMGLRVIRSDHSELSIWHALVRASLCLAFPVGLLWCALDPRGHAVHDVVLSTTVIYDWRRKGLVGVAGGTIEGVER